MTAKETVPEPVPVEEHLATLSTTAPKHPNAAASATALLAAGWIVALVAHFGYQLSTVTALTIVGFAGALRLYVGRRGIVGALKEAWQLLLWGSDGSSS